MKMDRLFGTLNVTNTLKKFGAKSEQYKEEVNLQLLFNELRPEAEKEQLPLEQEQISYVRKKGHDKKNPFLSICQEKKK